MKQPRRRRSLALVVGLTAALVTWLCPGCAGCGDSPSTFAILGELLGKVNWLQAEQWLAAEEGQGLSYESGVLTDADSEGTLAFLDQSRLRVLERTELRFQRGPDGKMRFTLLAGAIEVESKGLEMEFDLGNGIDMLFLNNGKLMLKRDGDEITLDMEFGDATMTRGGKTSDVGDGLFMDFKLGEEPEEMGMGMEFGLGADAGATQPDPGPPPEPDPGPPPEPDVYDAGPPDTGPPDVGPPDVGPPDTGHVADAGPTEPAGGVATFIDSSRKSRVRLPGSSKFTKPTDKEMPVPAGTAIRVSKKHSAALESAGGLKYGFGRGAQAIWAGMRGASGGREGKLTLSQGEARVRVRRSGGSRTARVVTAHADVQVKAHGLTGGAKVERRKDETRISVRLGSATVRFADKKIVVLAGQVLTVRADGSYSGPSSVGGAALSVTEGTHNRIYYDRKLSRLGFKWRGGGGKAVLEVSRSESFASPILAEPVKGSSFAWGGIGSGTYYWRVKKGGTPGPVGKVRLGSDPTMGGKGAVRNKVRDTGKETRIIFQGAHPALSFRWKKVDGAARYEFNLARESSPGSPFIKQKPKKNGTMLAAGRLKEGTYYWWQKAVDGDGKALITGQINKLSLKFDKSRAPTLRLDSYRGGKIKGLAAKGTGLTCNGTPVRTDADGMFSQRCKARGGLLVFRVRGGRGDTMYIRHAK